MIEDFTRFKKDFSEASKLGKGIKLPKYDKLVFCGIDRDGEALKYLISLKRSKFYIPRFIELSKTEELLELAPGTLIVFKSSKTKFIKPEAKKRLQEVAKGKLGHRKCTLYKLN